MVVNKKFFTGLCGVLFSVVAVMAATPLDTAMSNISTYLDKLPFGYPAILQSPHADIYVFGVSVLLLMLTFRSRLVALFKKTFFRISWFSDDAFLQINMSKHSKGFSGDVVIYGDIEYRVRCFYLKGRNNSGRPVDMVSGYIRSNKTNLRLPLLLDGMPPEQTYGIPARCGFYVMALFPHSTPPQEGYTPEDFWRHFGDFTFVFEYDGKVLEKVYTEKEVRAIFDGCRLWAEKEMIHADDKPRVKKRDADEAV